MDVSQKGVAPEVPLPRVVKVHPTHSCLDGVGAAKEAWFLRHNLSEEGRAVLEAGCKAGEGVNVEPEVTVYPHTVALGLLEC